MWCKIILASLFVLSANAAVNEPCYGEGGRAGVCLSTSSCSSDGGTTVDGACPWDASDVKCCTKDPCHEGGDWNCRFQSDCAGSTVSNQGPGPGQFMCCDTEKNGFGGYSAPSIPPVGACKSVAVSGAKKIVDAFPGRVREVFCIRDCACTSSGSDHCCGKATDMMCADGGGVSFSPSLLAFMRRTLNKRDKVPTTSGREIAEWAMENHSALNVKYIIWGQKIWSPSSDKATSWVNWRTMEDRGSITANHW